MQPLPQVPGVHRRVFLPLLPLLAALACSSPQKAEPPEQTAASPSVTVTSPPVASGPVQKVAPLAPPSTNDLPLSGYDVPGWAEAVAQVEEVRGSNERLDVPAELRHAADKRIFLAAQLADATSSAVHTPRDLGDIARMLRSGELVEVPPLSDDHLLYDVGADVTVDPMVHYDPETNETRPLDASDEDYGAITALAANFGGYSYDLAQPSDRSRFQARLLSALRPEARAVLDEIARAYHQRFGKRLPVSSLVRTMQYQRRLTRVNPNASKLDLSPHTTGLAFDVLYKFMPNDEQNLVMREIARLEQEGRVEALRERRNCFHVYVFEKGQRPEDTLVASLLDDVEAQQHPGGRTSVSRSRESARARVAARKTTARKKAAPASRTRRAARRR